jgi:hypothetical protein
MDISVQLMAAFSPWTIPFHVRQVVFISANIIADPATLRARGQGQREVVCC